MVSDQTPGLRLDRLFLRSTILDGDGPRLQRLGDLAHKVDMQQTVHQFRAMDAHMVGKLEAALKAALGNEIGRASCRERV